MHNCRKVQGIIKMEAIQQEKDNMLSAGSNVEEDYGEILDSEIRKISDYIINVTYSVFGYEEAGETDFEMELYYNDFLWLQNADDEGIVLDNEFIAENRRRIHRKILRAIRNNMEELSMEPGDGMVKVVVGISEWEEYNYSASHDGMSSMAEDDIEYSIILLD